MATVPLYVRTVLLSFQLLQYLASRHPYATCYQINRSIHPSNPRRPMRDEDTFSGFTEVRSPSRPGAFYNFLGAMTRTDFFGPDLQWLSGQVFDFPVRGNVPFFEYEEWQGVMQAVREAEGSWTCTELGCGWGPWLVSTTLAARQRGINDVSLTGVEASPSEIEKLRTHFRDNGLNANHHTIINAAIDDHDADPAPEHPEGAALLSLATLLEPYRRVDLIHCDIQFAEARSFRAGIQAVSEKVRRIVVGTHSRQIEDELIDLFQANGWQIECETPCRYFVNDGRVNLLADGAQVWVNPRV
ncbi:class I SAM-dependent methyltransferase [Methylobacterium komagatae]